MDFCLSQADIHRVTVHLPRVPLISCFRRKIAARCPDVPRDQVKCRQTPDYHDFTISSVFSATDQPLMRSALLTANWRGYNHRKGHERMRLITSVRNPAARVIATAS